MTIDTPNWVRDAVFYQIFPDRLARSGRVAAPGLLEPWEAPPTGHGFKGGDLFGVADRLDDLADLGVTALYLTPVFASASNHRYHTYDYCHVDPLLGGDEALRELLDQAHRRDMRVVLDGVFNHASRGFWPFQHVAENGADSPYRNWFFLDSAVLRGERGLVPYPDAAAMREIAGAGAGEGHRTGAVSERVLGYRAWWDLPALPKLNTSDPAMREYLLGVAEHWIRFGIDGWRLDVAQEVPDEYWREFRRRVRGVNPEAYIVAEIWREEPQFLQGDMFDALMNYPFAEAVIGFTAGRHLDRAVVDEQHEFSQFIRPLDGRAFAARLDHIVSMYDPEVVAVQLNLLGSHDVPRLVTVAGGDRYSVRLATLIQMTVPGAPCIYYGDEVGVEGHHDPDNRRSYPLLIGADERELRDFVAGAIWLRRSHETLRDRGVFRILGADGMAQAYGRFGDEEAFVVAVNAGEEAIDLECWAMELAGMRLVVETWAGNDDGGLDRADGVAVSETGAFRLPLLPRRGAVLRAIA